MHYLASAILELQKLQGIAGMRLSELDPLIPLNELREDLLKLPKGYSFHEDELVDFLSRRRWTESNRRIDRQHSGGGVMITLLNIKKYSVAWIFSSFVKFVIITE